MYTDIDIDRERDRHVQEAMFAKSYEYIDMYVYVIVHATFSHAQGEFLAKAMPAM